jgi:hypothetical protein
MGVDHERHAHLWWRGFMGRDWRLLRTGAEFTVIGQGGDPVADDPWSGYRYSHANDPRGMVWDNWVDAADNPTNMHSTDWEQVRTSGWYTDAAELSVRPDEIRVLNATKIYGAGAAHNLADAGFTGPSVGLRYNEASTGGGALVYLSFGFEQLNRGYHPSSDAHGRLPGPGAVHQRGRPARQ